MANVGTLYSQLNPVSFSEFSPSRVTRVSSNPFLQEHCPFSTQIDLQHRGRKGSAERLGESTPALPQKGYVQLEFSDNVQKASTDSVDDCYSTIRRYNPANRPWHPHSVIGYTTDSLHDDDSDGSSKFSSSYPGHKITQSLNVGNNDSLMDRPISFALAIGENPIFLDGEEFEFHRDPTTRFSRTISLDEPVSSDDTVQYINVSTSSVQVSPLLPAEHSLPPLYCNVPAAAARDTKPRSPISPLCIDTRSPGTSPRPPTQSPDSSAGSPPPPAPPPHCSFRLLHHNGHSSSPYVTTSMENILTTEECTTQLVYPTPPAFTKTNSSSTPNLFAVSPCNPTGTPSYKDSDVTSTAGSQNNLSSTENYGHYLVNYLGGREVDSYLNCINDCAKKILHPKANNMGSLSDDVIVEITLSKIRFFQPKSGVLLKSIMMQEVFIFSQCDKNKRIVGVLVWKRNSPTPICHLFRCPDQLVSNALMDALATAKQDMEYELKLNASHDQKDNLSLSVSLSSSCEINAADVLHKWKAIHVATVKVGKNQTVGSIIRKVINERRPSESSIVSVWVSLAQIRLVQTVNRKPMMYGQHDIGGILAIGTDLYDKRLIGYIVKEKSKHSVAYVIWCYTATEAGAMVSFLRQACQSVYHQRGGEYTTDTLDNKGDEAPPTGSKKGLLSLFHSLKPVTRGASAAPGGTGTGSPLTSPLNCPSSSSFQSYLSSQQISSSTVTDLPQKRKNSVMLPPTPLSSFESAESDHAKFSVMYVGSANLPGPFSSRLVSKSLEMFKEGGVGVGGASVPKNTIVMHISSLGINLTDKKQTMFINRNYPCKQILGHSLSPVEREYFGFATTRPGFRDQIRVHVFSQLTEPVKQVVDAMIFWLDGPTVTY